MTTLYPPELVRSTGTMTLEDMDIVAATGNAALLDFVSDISADAATVHIMTFTGDDDGANATIYAATVAKIIDNTNLTEDGSYTIQTMQAGSLTDNAVFALGLAMNGATGGDQGLGTGNFKGLFIEGVAVLTGGDVSGPGSVTDNAMVRFDGTGGKTIQESGVILDDSDNMTGLNNLTVGGNLTVSGTTTTINTATLSVEDPLIQLANGNNAADVLDLGFVALYDTSGSQDLYAGLFRDASDGKFRLFVDSQEDLATAITVNTGATGYAIATLVANLEGNVTGQVSDLSNHDTDDLSEGATNKYASTANVDAAGAVMETDYNANTVLAANADNTPLALTMGASTILARLAAGNIVAATPAELRTLLNVENQSEENLDWTSAIRVEGVDFTALDGTLTLPIAAPGDDEDHVRVSYDGIKQHASEWSVVGTTITFTANIPVGVSTVELQVLA